MNDKMWQESKKEDIKQEVKTEEGVMTEEEGEGSKMHRSVKDGKRPFTIVRHISLIQKMKDLTDQVTTSQQAEARVRKAKTAAVAKLLMEGIFYKIDQNLTWCETETEIHRERGSIAPRKVFARPESFCAEHIFYSLL